MKKHISFILLFCVLCSILSGCGKQEGSEFLGTWKKETEVRYKPEDIDERHQNIKIETYLVIEASENGKNTFTATEYRLEKEGESKYRASQKKFPLQRKDGILEKDFSKRYYIENGKLRENTAKEDYEHVSDKSMTFEELNNGRGYPAPK